MKTRLLSLLAILFMGLTFVGCSSDDDDGNSSAGIVGAWRFDYDDGDSYMVFTFKSDETGSLKIESEGGSEEIRFSYQYDAENKTLTTWDSSGRTDYQVVFLTNKKLVLNYGDVDLPFTKQ